MILTGRDASNIFLMDQVRVEERMQAMADSPHLIADAQIETVAYLVLLGVVWSVVAVVWWLAGRAR